MTSVSSFHAVMSRYLHRCPWDDRQGLVDFFFYFFIFFLILPFHFQHIRCFASVLVFTQETLQTFLFRMLDFLWLLFFKNFKVKLECMFEMSSLTVCLDCLETETKKLCNVTFPPVSTVGGLWELLIQSFASTMLDCFRAK